LWGYLAGWVVLLLVSCMALACMHADAPQGSAAGLRSALNVVHDVIDPAYLLARNTCNAQDDATASAVLKAPDGPEKIAARKRSETLVNRCETLMASFEAMRITQDKAADLLEQGKVADAQSLLDQLQKALPQAIAAIGGS
jgi:hypothetical protein